MRLLTGFAAMLCLPATMLWGPDPGNLAFGLVVGAVLTIVFLLGLAVVVEEAL